VRQKARRPDGRSGFGSHRSCAAARRRNPGVHT